MGCILWPLLYGNVIVPMEYVRLYICDGLYIWPYNMEQSLYMGTVDPPLSEPQLSSTAN